jgi:hypothetical protein
MWIYVNPKNMHIYIYVYVNIYVNIYANKK